MDKLIQSEKSKSETSKLAVNMLDSRRSFLNKYGKLAAITPLALTALVSPSTSAAPKSCKGNGKNSC